MGSVSITTLVFYERDKYTFFRTFSHKCTKKGDKEVTGEKETKKPERRKENMLGQHVNPLYIAGVEK